MHLNLSLNLSTETMKLLCRFLEENNGNFDVDSTVEFALYTFLRDLYGQQPTTKCDSNE